MRGSHSLDKPVVIQFLICLLYVYLSAVTSLIYIIANLMSYYHNDINNYLYVIVKGHHGKWLSLSLRGLCISNLQPVIR